MKINEISITGTELKPEAYKQPQDSLFNISQSFKIGGQSRDKTPSHTITLNDEDVIEFIFTDDTTWLSNQDTIQDIFPEAKELFTRDGENRFSIPLKIDAQDSERGLIKKAILKGVNILSKKTVQISVTKLAIELENKQLDEKIGVFRLAPDFQLLDFNKENEDKPFCLFIHGTASSISGSFSAIKGTDFMRFLKGRYADRILAFQHRTLSENPLQNVKELIQHLPKQCTLHLITTSRGGLVGEVLSRFCNSDGVNKGFTNDELEFLKKEYPKRYFESLLAEINEINTELRSKNISIEKFIRIACPAGGTTLASKRLDNFFNITFNLLGLASGQAGNPLYMAFKNLVTAVVSTRNNVNVLPGLEVQNPSSPFITVINGLNVPQIVQIDNSLVVISGNSKIEFKFSALLVIASKLFYRRENDLVVDTVSMALGTPRTGKVQEFFYDGKNINNFKYFENEITSNAVLQALNNKWGDTLPGFTTEPVEKSDARDFDMTEIEIDNPLLKLSRKKTKVTIHKKPIRVSISRGDLSYARYPVMAGHFEDDSILYAEKQIDKTLDGMLSQFLQLGNYPGKIKESKVFLTSEKSFKGAVIVGLGKLENLTPSELVKTVEMGVVNFLFDIQRKNCSINTDSTLGLSSLIIGCGYGGLTIENSIRAIIQGVHNANISINELNAGNKCTVEHIEFIEVYEDKAINSLFAISRIEKDETKPFSILQNGKDVIALLGSKKRIPLDATEEWWNRLSVVKVVDDKNVIRELKFNTSTKSAREKQQPLFTSPALMEATIEEISTNNSWTSRRAKTIFEMLIPNDFKDELKRHGNIIWVLDAYTASYPWELLQDGFNGTKPICVSSGMVRQLKSENYRKTIKTAAKNNALVVADPILDGFIGQLNGALQEGKKVMEILSRNGVEVSDSFNEQHSDIMEKLFGNAYKIIHLSGHGVFHADATKGSGMVIGKNLYLSTREIQQMSTVPEFVFVNCCHLGKTVGIAEEYYQQRFKLAANIGTQLINNGVRCVIAAGWAVDDAAALKFAEVFYEHMTSGAAFGEAVKAARKAVYKEYNYTNTWGAYQAYGDPYYRFRKPEHTNTEKSYLIAKEAEIDMENLLSTLEIGDLTTKQYNDRLTIISDAVESAEIRNCTITELEALINMELRNYNEACNLFDRLLNGKDASFSFSCIEKFYNAKAKRVINEYRADKRSKKDYVERINEAIQDIKTLLKISPSPERINILGSTYKREAFLLKEQDTKLEAYKNAAFHYQNSYSKFRTWYALTNWLTIESILILAEKRKWKDLVKTQEGAYDLLTNKDALVELRDQEEAIPKTLEFMNYWDMIAAINIKLCRYIVNFSKFNARKYLDNILAEISMLWAKAGSKGQRFAEIEHLEFNIDMLSIVENSQTTALRENLEYLKNKLEELITNESLTH